MDTNDISLTQIGHVECDVAKQDIPRNRRNIISDIVIDEQYLPAIKGIEAYSHLFVLFWMHETDPCQYKPQVHPRGRDDLPLMGILATRNRHHPNPIGLAVVELKSVNQNRLTVKKLDAYNQSPILDIKPYDPYDVQENIRLPDWWGLKNGQKSSKC